MYGEIDSIDLVEEVASSSRCMFAIRCGVVISKLHDTGFTPEEIAAVLHTNPRTVSFIIGNTVIPTLCAQSCIAVKEREKK